MCPWSRLWAEKCESGNDNAGSRRRPHKQTHWGDRGIGSWCRKLAGDASQLSNRPYSHCWGNQQSQLVTKPFSPGSFCLSKSLRVQEVREIFSNQDPANPTLVLVADWSKYVSSTYATTVEYGLEIARQLNQLIFQWHIPVERLTIFGNALILYSFFSNSLHFRVTAFGTSTHVAGYIGKLTESIHGAIVYRIIALNPTGLVYTGAVEVEHRLSRSDASTVSFAAFSGGSGRVCFRFWWFIRKLVELDILNPLGQLMCL